MVNNRFSRAGALLAVACALLGACERGPDAAVVGETPASDSLPDEPPSIEPRVADAHTPMPREASPAVAVDVEPFVPAWAADAVFYQLFPERFRNGDRTNDPTRASLEFPENVSDKWRITSWTSDWYSRADWERERGPNFYDNGVFDRRYGGDLQGVLDKLDYLAELGINVIYFNPVFYAKSLHKYDGASMHHIDPYFGPDPAGDLTEIAKETSDPQTWKWTAADKLFLKLIEEAHHRGLRVIVDGVFNHTGRAFFAFADLRQRQAESPYQDWYIVQTFDDPATPQNEFRYRSWWGIDTLPEFADNSEGTDLHPGPKQYVMDITSRWMDPNGDGDPEDGIDGWRLDVANEVPTGFWQDWNKHVRTLNPQAYTVGEFWGNARDTLIESHFSATMNYHGFAFPMKGFLIDGKLSANDFLNELDARRTQYPEPMQYALQNLVDSHDTDRIASMMVNAARPSYAQADRFDFDVTERVSPRYSNTYEVRKPNNRERRIQRMIALLQMTFVGPPMIYYGTEAGMWGGDDPDDRMPMVWRDLVYDDQAADPLGRARTPDQVEFDQELFDYYRAAIRLRKESATLRRGTFEIVAHDDAAQFVVFRRELAGESMLVLFNRGESEYAWNSDQLPADAEQVFASAADTENLPVEATEQGQAVTLPALSAVVYRVRPPGE